MQTSTRGGGGGPAAAGTGGGRGARGALERVARDGMSDALRTLVPGSRVRILDDQATVFVFPVGIRQLEKFTRSISSALAVLTEVSVPKSLLNARNPQQFADAVRGAGAGRLIGQ